MSTLEVNTITPQSGTTLTLGGSGDTINLGSGASGIATVNGITEADQFRLIADMSSSGAIITNIERVDNATFSKLGTGMSESSGTFTFPSTGLWMITANIAFQSNNSNTDLFYAVIGQISSNSGSSYDGHMVMQGGYEGANTKFEHSTQSILANVTDASTFRYRFVTDSLTAGTNLNGNTAANYTTFMFIRLGDSQ